MTIEKVLSWLNNNKFIYWRVVYANTSDVFSKFQPETDNPTLEESLKLFSENMEIIPEGIYSVYGRKKDADRAGESKMLLTIGKTSNQIQENLPNREFTEAIALMQSEINSLRLERQHEKEIESIKRDYESQITGLKNRISNQNQKNNNPLPWDKIGLVLGQVFGNNPLSQPIQNHTIEGNQESEESEEKASYTEFLAICLENIKKAINNEQNFYDVFGILSALSQQNPIVFQTYVNTILNMKPKKQAKETKTEENHESVHSN